MKFRYSNVTAAISVCVWCQAFASFPIYSRITFTGAESSFCIENDLLCEREEESSMAHLQLKKF